MRTAGVVLCVANCLTRHTRNGKHRSSIQLTRLQNGHSTVRQVWIDVGETVTAEFVLSSSDVHVWDVVAQRWKLVAETHGVNVGSGSRDIRLHGTVEIVSA